MKKMMAQLRGSPYGLYSSKPGGSCVVLLAPGKVAPIRYRSEMSFEIPQGVSNRKFGYGRRNSISARNGIGTVIQMAANPLTFAGVGSQSEWTMNSALHPAAR
jgi:hypothetical protein